MGQSSLDLPCGGLRSSNCDYATDMTGAHGVIRFIMPAMIRLGADRLYVRTAGCGNSGRTTKGGQDNQYECYDHSHATIIYQRLIDCKITKVC